MRVSHWGVVAGVRISHMLAGRVWACAIQAGVRSEPSDAAQVLAWADRIARWSFTSVIPGHFAGPVRATPREFRAAFGFLEDGGSAGAGTGSASVLSRLLGGRRGDKRVGTNGGMREIDLEFLQGVDEFITEKGLAAAAAVATPSGERRRGSTGR